MSAREGDVCLGYLPGGSAQGVWQTPPPCEQNDKTGVKTLPCRKYIADGNQYFSFNVLMSLLLKCR